MAVRTERMLSRPFWRFGALQSRRNTSGSPDGALCYPERTATHGDDTLHRPGSPGTCQCLTLRMTVLTVPGERETEGRHAFSTSCWDFAATEVVRTLRAIMPEGKDYQNEGEQRVLSRYYTKKLCDPMGSLQVHGPIFGVPHNDMAYHNWYLS